MVFRLSTFSQIPGNVKVDKSRKSIFFQGALSFQARMLEEELIDRLTCVFFAMGKVRPGRTDLPPVSLSSSDWLLFSDRALIRMQMPVTLHRTHENGNSFGFGMFEILDGSI